jgi:TolB protein
MTVMIATRARAGIRRPPVVAVLFLALAAGAETIAADRIFVDQWSPTRSELVIADADGSHPRKLVPGSHIDYNASFSFDGQWIVFTSERYGSADIFRVHPNGMSLERLTDDPAFDDQAALSPDGRSVAFVSSRDAGSTDIYLLDLSTKSVRNLTNTPGGDFRPSWSPDGQLIAFSSDRGTPIARAEGHWEQVHATSIYVMRPDGSGVRKVSREGRTAGSPRWSADGKQLVFYEVAVGDTFDARQVPDQPNVESRIVSVDVATGATHEHATGRGLKLSPQFLGEDRVGYLSKKGATASLVFTSGERGATGDIGNPSWSRDGKQVVYHSGPIATIPEPRTPGQRLSGRDPQVDLRFASGFPAVSPDGRQLVVSERTGRGNPDDRTALVVWNADGTNPRRIFRGEGSVMGPQWSPDGRTIVFGAGSYFLARKGRPAQIMVVRPDGSEARALPTGSKNAGFPSWSPDGTQVVYRYWSDTAGGLRIINVKDGAVRTLTTGYDNFPMWSPRGDVIAFSRAADDDFDIYTIRPDGSDVRRLTDAKGNDSHPAWSPDGRRILFSSSRFGFKDEAPLFDIPQPYGELFVMNADGSDQRPLTDNRWEEGTPSWAPDPAATKTSSARVR